VPREKTEGLFIYMCLSRYSFCLSHKDQAGSVTSKQEVFGEDISKTLCPKAKTVSRQNYMKGGGEGEVGGVAAMRISPFFPHSVL